MKRLHRKLKEGESLAVEVPLAGGGVLPIKVEKARGGAVTISVPAWPELVIGEKNGDQTPLTLTGPLPILPEVEPPVVDRPAA